MSEQMHFKIKEDSAFHRAVKEVFEQDQIWRQEMFEEVRRLLGVDVERMGFDPKNLYLDPAEIKKHEELKPLFKKDGALKKNVKKANEIRKSYVKAVEQHGLQNYQPLGLVNFTFNAMRMGDGTGGTNEEMRSYRSSDDVIYYEANFDLAERTKGQVVPISAVEYHETYAKEIRKQEEAQG